MERPAKLLSTTCLTMMVAATWPNAAAAAEDEAAIRELWQVRTSDQVVAAQWVRRPDSYLLKVALDPSRYDGRRMVAADPVAGSPSRENEQIAATPDLPARTLGIEPMERGSFFIGATIANLRGRDPWLECGRELTLVNGRQQANPYLESPTPEQPARPYMNQPYPPKHKDRRVEVWLLKADGTQIMPAIYNCDAGPTSRLQRPAPPVEISYEFPLAAGEQAVAATIRIDDSFYIEMLSPRVTKAASR